MLRAVLKILVRNACPRGPTCFRCIIFSLSGSCELLFSHCFIASWIRVEVSVMSYPCMSMDLFVWCVAHLTVFVICLLKQFAICLGVVVILLLNIMVMFNVVGGALLDRPCMVFHIVCVLCP